MANLPDLDVRTVLLVLVAIAGCRAVLHHGRSRSARARLRGRSMPGPIGRGWLPNLGGTRLADVPPSTAWAGVAAAVLAAAVVGPVVVALGSVVGGLVAVGVSHEQRRSARRRADALIPGFLDELARRLRAGRSLRSAVEEAGAVTAAPLGPGLVAAARRSALGVPLGESLDAFATAQASPSLRLVVAALDLATHTGASQAQAVEGVATTLRDRLALGAEVRALASQARASAAVLVVAPVAFAIVIALADPSTAHFLFATPTGLVCLAAGLGLDALGAWWMQRLTAAVG